MPKPLSVTHTIKSHGVQVVRLHMHDWLILALPVVLEFVLSEIVPPFHWFARREMMVDLKYPLKNNTVPSWTLLKIGILVPFVFIFVYYIIRRNVHDFHHATLGILFVVFFTGVITNAIKDAIGRPRPDFFWRCFPDGKDEPLELGDDAAYSVPGPFAGLGFLSLYLSAKIQAFDQKGHVAKLCIVFLPLLFAILVGISRVDDYQHHWHDVFAGGFLGMTVATFCYLLFFPATYHSHGLGKAILIQSAIPRQEDNVSLWQVGYHMHISRESDCGYIPLQLTEVGTA